MKNILTMMVTIAFGWLGGGIPSAQAQPTGHFARFQAVTQGGGGTTLPLDAVTGNYSAAYSTRLLRAAYAGALINVRRSSDNATQDFYQGATAGSLNTTKGGGGTDLLAWVGANDGLVTEWYDQSGQGNHMLQNTTGSQPKVVSSGAFTSTQNGHPCIQFASQFLVCMQSYAAPANFTIYATAKATGSVAYMGLFRPDNPTTGWLFCGNLNGTQVGIARVNNGVTATTGFTTGTTWLFDASYDGSTDTLFRNGGSDSGGTNIGAGWGTASASIGSGYSGDTGHCWSGWISEILVYSTGHSTGNKATLRSNIDAFWAIY
jgi:hypothetical protein